MTQDSSSLIPPPSSLRWWGWGTLDRSFDLSHRPSFGPHLRDRLGASGEVTHPPVGLDSIALPDSRLSPQDLSELRRIFGDEGVRTDQIARILHAYGKSYRDLIRIRRGEVQHPPDAVVCPSHEAQIAELFALAALKRWQVVPFGGGSGVTGGLEPALALSQSLTIALTHHPTITLSLARLNRVLAIDRTSHTATVQCGIFGPDLEARLNAEGFTLGHFPQSFEFSTLGGWIATRSAGQTSMGYGKIEDMVERLRLIAPRGAIDVKPLPARATGPDVLNMLIGSEGTFGVITEATLRVRPLPEARDYRGVLFHTFADGVEAIRELMQRDTDAGAVMARLSDADETNASLALSRAPATPGARLKLRAGAGLMRQRGYDLASSCLMVIGLEGTANRVRHIKQIALGVCRSRDGIDLGSGIGRSWLHERFTLPYLRDDLLDRGIMIDTLETAATWSSLLAVYAALRQALHEAIAAGGARPLVMTHVSHAYRDGASLYATFLGRQADDPIAQWWSIKRAATEAILAQGGALSHHHGIGRDHASWLRREHGDLAMRALRALKTTFDPDGLLNRGVMDLDYSN